MIESRVVSSSSEAVSLVSATSGAQEWQYGPVYARSRCVVVKETAPDLVFVGDYDGWIHKLSFKTGSQLAKFEVGGPVRGLTYAGGVLYANVGNSLQALDPVTGHLWTHPMGDLAWGDPVASNGIVYAGSWDSKLYAVSSDGTPAWTSTAFSFWASVPTVVDGLVYASGSDSQDEYLVALDAASGEVVWKAQASNKATIVDPVAVGDGRVYAVTGWGARLCAFDAATGAQQWSVQTTGHSATPLFWDGRIYVASEHGAGDGELQAYDAATGALLWISETPTGGPGHSGSRPAIDQGGLTDNVFVTSQDGYLHAFDRDTGELAWKVAIGDGFPIEPTWTDASGPLPGRRPRLYATIDPLALLLPGPIYAKINLPNPPPIETIVARLRKSVAPGRRDEVAGMLAALRSIGSFVESFQEAIQKHVRRM